MEQELCMTILYWVEELYQSVWNVCIKFDIPKEHLKMFVLEVNIVVLNGNSVKRKPCK